MAILTQPGQPVRRLALARRADAECLSDELARLDPDDVYAQTLQRGLPLLRGKAVMTVTEATDKGLAPDLAEARWSSAEIHRRSAGQAGAAMVERAAPSPAASEDVVRRRARRQHDQVTAERAGHAAPGAPSQASDD